MSIPSQCVIVAVALIVSCPWSASAGAQSSRTDASQAFSVFDTSGMRRLVHGRRESLDLAAGRVPLGHAQAFFGVDDSSSATRRYLTSGLEWRASAPASPFDLGLGGMHVVSRGSAVGGQTLLQATSNFDLGGSAFVPDLSFMTAEVDGSGPAGAGLSGRASRYGLSEDYAGGGYKLDYFSASPGFDTWGSPLASSGQGVELQSYYDGRSGWRVHNTLRVHDRTTERGLVDRFTISGRYAQSGTGRPWALSAQFGSQRSADRRPISLRLASRTQYWRDWHVDTAMGWYQGDVTNPQNRPVEGGLWSLSFDRRLAIAGMAARLRPRFALGGTRDSETDYAGLAGIGLVFPGIADQFVINMDYASAGWVPVTHGGGDMRVSLNFAKNAGQILSPLRSLIDRF